MINQAGLDLIKHYEGLRLKAYRDAVGVWTIGYGHTSMAGDPKVKAGMVITEDEAEQILRTDLKKYEDAVKKALPGYPLTDNQYAALTSLCYNVGPGNFSKSSVVRYLRQGNPGQSADAFRAWNKAGGRVLQGLVTRREAERKLFLS